MLASQIIYWLQNVEVQLFVYIQRDGHIDRKKFKVLFFFQKKYFIIIYSLPMYFYGIIL